VRSGKGPQLRRQGRPLSLGLCSVRVVSGRRRRPGKRRRAGRSAGGVSPFWRDESGLDAEIVALEDDPDAMRVTVDVSVVVRVTRAQVLDRFAREAFVARRETLSPDDFAPLAYQAACEEGLDDIAGGPAGQLRFLIDPGAIVAGIPGVGVEDVRIVIEKTPAEVVRQLREDHGFLEDPDDEPPCRPVGAESPDHQDLPF
jgi:alkanesulfonate monooxygenase SsuD/methylene tetrahydromethanopterin reductase-like flavin-dependent oxidoreductase (luciferase family)